MVKAADHFSAILKDVAILLLGNPNPRMSSKDELRWGNKGSLSVRVDKGVFFDNESGTGGGVLDLVERERGLKGKDAVEWLRGQGFDIPDERPPPTGTPSSARQSSRPVDPDNVFSWNQTAHFDYVDEQGKLLFQVVRLESGRTGKDGKPEKTFRQRRPDPDQRSGWTWKVQGTRQVPYRLPEVLQAVQEGLIVFIAEGEKAVEALRARGIVATCNAGGAGKFPDDLVGYFKGAEVVVLADNDPQARYPDDHPKNPGGLRFHADGSPVFPGQDHAREVARKLAPVAAKVTTLEFPELPPKGDIVEWFESGKTVDDLYERVHNAPPPTGGAPAFTSRFHAIPWADLDNPGPEHEWLIGGLLTRYERSMLVGPSQSGKSFLALDLAMCVARGVPFFGMEAMKGGVIYQAGEGGLGLKKRIRAYRDEHHLTLADPLPFVLLPAALDLYASDDHTAAFIAEVKHWAGTFDVPLELVVIDTLAAATPGANENASEDMSRVLARCTRIAEACRCAVMIVHHANAGGHKPRGHTSILANLDTVITVQMREQSRDGDGRPIRDAEVAKQKDGERGKKFPFVLKGITLGEDSTGRAITSCVVKKPYFETEEEREAGFSLNGANSRLLFQALVNALRSKGQAAPSDTAIPFRTRVVERKYWREEFAKIAPFDEGDDEAKRKERVKKAFQRAHTEFQNWRLMKAEDPYVWLSGKKVNGFDLSGLLRFEPLAPVEKSTDPEEFL